MIKSKSATRASMLQWSVAAWASAMLGTAAAQHFGSQTAPSQTHIDPHCNRRRIHTSSTNEAVCGYFCGPRCTASNVDRREGNRQGTHFTSKIEGSSSTGYRCFHTNGVPPEPFIASITCTLPSPTASPVTQSPTTSPTPRPSSAPTATPTPVPTAVPTASPTPLPTPSPTLQPTSAPTATPTTVPTAVPTGSPTDRSHVDNEDISSNLEDGSGGSMADEVLAAIVLTVIGAFAGAALWHRRRRLAPGAREFDADGVAFSRSYTLDMVSNPLRAGTACGSAPGGTDYVNPDPNQPGLYDAVRSNPRAQASYANPSNVYTTWDVGGLVIGSSTASGPARPAPDQLAPHDAVEGSLRATNTEGYVLPSSEGAIQAPLRATDEEGYLLPPGEGTTITRVSAGHVYSIPMSAGPAEPGETNL